MICFFVPVHSVLLVRPAVGKTTLFYHEPMKKIQLSLSFCSFVKDFTYRQIHSALNANSDDPDQTAHVLSVQDRNCSLMGNCWLLKSRPYGLLFIRSAMNR